MAPLLKPGWYVLASPNIEAKNENLAVVKLKEDQVMINEFHFNGGKVLLHSFNPKYDDLEFACEAQEFIYPIVLLKIGK